jgi:hypothetical protein
VANVTSMSAHEVPPSTPPRDPFSPGLQKASAASGIAFVVFVVLSIAFGGAETPDLGAPVEEYAEYAADNDDKLKVGLLLTLFAGFSLLWFSGVLRSALGRAETLARGFTRLSHVAFAGGIVVAIGSVLNSTMYTAAVVEDDMDGETVRAIVHLADSTGALLPLGFAALLIPSAFVMLRAVGFPRWLGFVGLVSGVAFVVLFFYALVIDKDDSPLEIAWPIGFLALLIWLVGTSVHLIRSVGAADTVRPVPPAGG